MKNLSFSLFLLLFLFASCGKEDITPNEPTADDEAAALAEEAAIADRLEYKRLMQAICTSESTVPDVTTYLPAEGEVLYEVSPGVRYLGFETEADARHHFLTFMLPLGYDESHLTTASDGCITYTIQDATLTYTVGGADGALANVELTLPECPEWKRLVFLPANEWPNNNMQTPTDLGDVWEHDGKLYLVTREYLYGRNGKMICFDEKPPLDPYRAYTYWMGDFDLWLECASYETWQGLRTLRHGSRDHLELVIETVKKNNPNSRLWSELHDILTEHYWYDVGKPLYDHYLYWAHWTYSIFKTVYVTDEDRFFTEHYIRKDTPHRYWYSTEVVFDDKKHPMAWGWNRVSMNYRPNK